MMNLRESKLSVRKIGKTDQDQEKIRKKKVIVQIKRENSELFTQLLASHYRPESKIFVSIISTSCLHVNSEPMMGKTDAPCHNGIGESLVSRMQTKISKIIGDLVTSY